MVRKSWRRLSGLIVLGLAVGLYLWAAPPTAADHIKLDRVSNVGPDLYHTGVDNDGCSVINDSSVIVPIFRCIGATVYNFTSEDTLERYINRDFAQSSWSFNTFLKSATDVVNNSGSSTNIVTNVCASTQFREGSVVRGDINGVEMATIKLLPPPADRDLQANCNEGLRDKVVFMFCRTKESAVAGGSVELEVDRGDEKSRKPTCVFMARERMEDDIPPPPPPPSNEDSTDNSTDDSDTSENALVADNPAQACGGPTLRSFDWVWCGMLDSLSDGIESLERGIYGHLRIDREKYQGVDCDGNNPTGPCNYRKAWSNVRNLTTLAIVGTALVMVIATALDFGWFSNYTVKKYLARLIAGTILVQLSWAVGDFIIVFGNQLGSFIGGVITAPFQGSTVGTVNAEDIGLAHVFNDGKAAGLASVGFLAGGAALWFGLIGIVPIILTLLVGALMILAGFMFLVFREFMIIMLLVAAPFGVALWFLPGSDKTWRLYYRTFLSLVLIYPIIVAVIAAGRSFIWVLINSGSYGPIDSLVAFFVYVGMFAAIPLLFKRFLGSINQLTGGSNNPAKGLIDRVRNARKGSMDRSRGYRREAKNRSDDQHLAENKDAPGRSWAGMRNLAIRTKRKHRAGAPMVSVRGHMRQAARATQEIEQAKVRKTQLDDTVGAIERNYDAGDPQAIGPDPLMALAGDSSRSQLENEAALVVLAKRKQHNQLRQIHALRANSPQIDRAWRNVARDGTFRKELDDVAFDISRDSVDIATNLDYRSSALANTSDSQLGKQESGTVGRLREHLEASMNHHADNVTASQEVQRVAQQVERMLEVPVLTGAMDPGSLAQFREISASYKQFMTNAVAGEINTQGGAQAMAQNVATLQASAVNAANSTQTLGVEVNRQASITVAASAGHESIVRDVYSSADQNVQGSLKAIVKGGGLKGGGLERVAPQLSSLSIDKKGVLSKPEDFDWVKAGLDQNQLLTLSHQSVAELESYVMQQLPRAQTNNRLRQNLKAYSARQINDAAAAARVAGWHQKADAFERIDNTINNL